MFQGHLGAALLISGALGRPIPLSILFVLSQLQDIVLVYLAYVKGIEKVDYQNPRTNTVNPLDLIYVPYSHGLVFSILFSIAAFLIFRGRAAKIAALASVASHWFLDLIVHEPDLDVCFPFAECPVVGLGLWRYLWPSIILECAIVIIGAAAYMGVIKERALRRQVMLRLVPFTMFMVFVTVMLPFAPPPPRLNSSIAKQVYPGQMVLSLVAWAVEKPLRNSIKRD